MKKGAQVRSSKSSSNTAFAFKNFNYSELSKRFQELMRLPEPTEIFNSKPSKDEYAQQEIIALFNLIIKLLNDKNILQKLQFAQSGKRITKKDQLVALEVLIYKLFSYFNYFVQIILHRNFSFISTGKKARSFVHIPCLDSQSFNILAELTSAHRIEFSKNSFYDTPRNHSEIQIRFLYFFHIYNLSYRAVIFTQQSDFKYPNVEHAISICLISMRRAEKFKFSNKFLQPMIANTFDNYLELLDRLREIQFKTSEEHLPGAFSYIKTGELSPLAARSKSVLSKYGEKNVATQFEFTMSLVIQSFGFSVVNAERGEKAIDLICISNDSNCKFTMIIDAKSSSSNYALPASDERAISEYIATISNRFVQLPNLKIALIVGPSPSKTLPEKLKALNATLSVPIRYLEARTLARLREQLVGKLDLGDFLNTLLTSNLIISPSDLDKLILRQHEREKNLTVLVKSVLK